MRRAEVWFDGNPAGVLVEEEVQGAGRKYRFYYCERYSGPPISVTLPVREDPYLFDGFPPFFDGLLPEGFLLDALLLQKKLDRDDLFGQLVTVGGDMVGAVTVRVVS